MIRQNVFSGPVTTSEGFIIFRHLFNSLAQKLLPFIFAQFSLCSQFRNKKAVKTQMEDIPRILVYFGWRTDRTGHSMFTFIEVKTMPVQQIVVNPVTLQQTNNKERKVSFSLRNAFLSTLWYRNLAHLTYIRPMKLAADFSHLFDLFIFDGTIEFSKNGVCEVYSRRHPALCSKNKKSVTITGFLPYLWTVSLRTWLLLSQQAL